MPVKKRREYARKSFEINIKHGAGRKFVVNIVEEKGRDTFSISYTDMFGKGIEFDLNLAGYDELIASLEEVREHSNEAKRMEKDPTEEKDND